MIKNNSIPRKQSEQIQSISGCGTRNKNSVPRKQNKNLSQNNKNYVKGYISSSGVGILK